MDGNSSAPSEPPTEGEDGESSSQSFASPVSILPLVISVSTMVAIVVVACVLWRRRQRRRARELSRQLTVTQKRIDSLKALREKEIAASKTKAEYHPPADLPPSVSSVDDVSLRRIRSARNRPGHFTLNLSEAPIHTSSKTKGSKSGTMATTPSLPPPGPISENDSSFQCSTCRGSTVFTGGHVPTDSSMAVEYDTTNPSISPPSTKPTVARGRSQYSSQPQEAYPSSQVLSDTSASAITTSNVGTWGSSSTLQPSTIPHTGTTPLWEDVIFDPTLEGRPNTPVSMTTDESSIVVVRTDGHASDEQEKWV